MPQVQMLLERVRRRSDVHSPAAAADAEQLVHLANGTEHSIAAATAAAWLFWRRGEREPATQLFRQLLRPMPEELQDRFVDLVGHLPPDHDVPDLWLRLEIVAAKISHLDWSHFRTTGSPESLFRAASFASVACTACSRPEDLAERVAFAGNALRVVFEQTGDESALSQAVHLSRIAVRDNPADPWHRTNLGNALAARFRYTGDIDDAAEAMAEHGSALREAAAPRALAAATSGLAGILHLREAVANVPADPDEIIELLRTAVGAFDDGDDDRLTAINNLGAALSQRRRPEDLDEAVSLLRDVVAADHPGRAMGATNLGQALLHRHALTRRPADAVAAAEALRLAVELSPDGHPGLANRLNSLAQALLRLHPPDRAGAESAWARAGRMTTTPAVDRMSTGNFTAEWAATHGRWSEAVSGYAGNIELLRHVLTGLGRESQERMIDNWVGLAGDAAACAVAGGQPETALLLLEQGRGILATAVLDARQGLSSLRLARPDLAERLERARAESR